MGSCYLGNPRRLAKSDDTFSSSGDIVAQSAGLADFDFLRVVEVRELLRKSIWSKMALLLPYSNGVWIETGMTAAGLGRNL